MEFHEVADPGAYHWRRGVFGIEEPDEDLPRVAAEKMDWILVPGVLFGKSGERIGMGRGFYDRFLKEAVNAVKVGVAYEFQVKPNLPQENWDARMDWVVTAWEVIQVRA
jgi:5-formyltetrahydrofolate cyclo-ligase